MSTLAVRLQPEPVRSLAAASIVAGYTAVGTPLVHPARIVIFNNLTDEAVMVSFDGVNDHVPLAGPGSFVIDITANKALSEGLFVAQGTQFYVKRIGTPSSSSFYISVFYGDNGYN